MPNIHLYSIPTLKCPFIPHEDAILVNKIEEHTSAWLRRFGLIKSPDHEAFYIKQKFAAMIVSSYPFASEDALCAWCDLNTYLFLLDDELDETTSVNTMAQMDELVSLYLGVLNFGLPDKCQDKMLIAFYDILKRLRELGTPSWQNTFLENIMDMFIGGKWQLSTILDGSTPTLSAYIEMRQYLGAAHLATDSLPLMTNVILPDEITSHSIFKKMVVNARNVICYANDLFSLGKELSQSTTGADFNLVSILMRAKDISIEEAIYEAAKMHDEEMDEFISNSSDVLLIFSRHRDRLRKYIDALNFLISGNVFWSTKISTRYPHIYENTPRGI